MIRAMIAFIDGSFTRPIGLNEVAASCHTNITTASRLFKHRLGCGFVQYLTALRIRKAGEYLEKTDLSIEEICSRLGYADYFYFNKVFKKRTGQTPRQYRVQKKSGKTNP
jgi:two-component system response regulator YesN